MSKRTKSEYSTPAFTLNDDIVLTGHNPASHIVGVQQLDDSTIRLYTRPASSTEPGGVASTVSSSDVEFFPFFFLSSPVLLDQYKRKFWIKELSGSGFFRFLVAFPRWQDLWEAVRSVLHTYNKTALRRAGHYTEVEPLLLRPDPVTQYLLQSGTTLFKGMSFEDLHRVQLSIQTLARPGKPSDPRKTEDRILVIGLSDNLGWEDVLDGRHMSEVDLIRRLAEILQQRNPDVLEGHELVDYALPYLARRAELLSVGLPLGRDGSDLRSYSHRGTPLEATSEGSVFEIAGRHIVDVKTLAHAYNFSKRALEHYGLRLLAQHFGFSPKSPPTIVPERIAATWHEDPQLVLHQASLDCREVRFISEQLLPVYFFQAPMVPLSFETLVRAGSAAKIELMMLREYIRAKHAVPKPQPGSQHSGGYTDLFVTGVVENVLHADIESLYPSIMLSKFIAPASDELGIFQQLLKRLRAERLEVKHRMLENPDTPANRPLDAFQSTLKVLINSFYGYLGYPRGLFNDFAQADRVTSSGQELLRSIIKEVELHNGTVIEADTDGLFFIPPDNVVGEEQELILIEKLSASLPESINLVLAGRYKQMLSYRKKNYALLDYKNRLTIKGSALISRSLERFARNYIQLCIQNLLRKDITGLHTLFVSFAHDIGGHEWDAQDFCRTETIRDSLDRYDLEVRDGSRKPSAAYEVAKRSGRIFKPGDSIAYYVTGQLAGVKIIENCRAAEEWDPNFPDENTAYYLDRLIEVSRKFDPFFQPEDSKRIFSTDDLFGFDPAGIRVLLQKGPLGAELPPAEDEYGEFGIWLDETA